MLLDGCYGVSRCFCRVAMCYYGVVMVLLGGC